MKKNRLFTAIYLAAAASIVAGCSQDGLTDDTSLPQGEYPLQIASVTVSAESTAGPWDADSPQTRVAESADGNGSVWQWDGTEQIGVQIANSTQKGVYTLNTVNAGNAVTASQPAYWPDKNRNTVTAWYPAGETLDLSDQSGGLKYVMTASATGTYTDPVSLGFRHSLAKVRVALGDGSTADLFNDAARVEVYGYTSCKLSKGTVDENSLATEGYITMHRATYGSNTFYEANMVPKGSASRFRITLRDKTAKEMTIGSPVSLTAGHLHVVTLMVTNAPIDISRVEAVSITDNGTYTITGKGTATVTINGSPTVTLKNVEIDNNNCIHITGGSPTILLEGENKLHLSEYYPNRNPLFCLEGEDTNVTIRGNGTLEIRGADNGNYYMPAIASAYGKKCGNITIEDCTIKAYASSVAGIGASSRGSCGNITIRNATVDVKGSPAIGASTSDYKNMSSNCGNIFIENTGLTASVDNRFFYNIPVNHAVIGCGTADYSGCTITCGSITIVHTGKKWDEILSTITGGNPLIGMGTNVDNTSTCGQISIFHREGVLTAAGEEGIK